MSHNCTDFLARNCTECHLASFQFTGNTALALMLGAQRRFEVTGEAHFTALTQRFVDLVVSKRSYATGGSTHNELWEAPGQLGHTLAHGGARHEHAESCTTHNMVRLVGMLLRASGGALAYADFIERALLNGVLGTQRGSELAPWLGSVHETWSV